MKTVVHCKGNYLSKTETWIYGQIINLKNYKPIIYCDSVDNLDIFQTDSIRIFKWSSSNKNILIRIFTNRIKRQSKIIYHLLRDKPKLMHAHYGPEGYIWLRYKRFFNIPMITTFYGFDVNMIIEEDPNWIPKYKQLFHFGDCFLVEGTHMKKCLIKLGCPANKIIVQHLGIDLNKIKFIPRKIPIDNTIKILISGSFREKKGIPYAIEAFGKVKTKCTDLNFSLTIIGDSNKTKKDEEEKQKILEKIKEYHLESCTTMLGYQPYPILIKEFYKNHIFISPSVTAADRDTEGGAPVSIIEASASGMPILSTTHCDIPEIVINNESGYLVPERDVDALAEKLEFLVRNPDIWENMGLVGRRHIEENYDVKKQVQILEKIYNKLSQN